MAVAACSGGGEGSVPTTSALPSEDTSPIVRRNVDGALHIGVWLPTSGPAAALGSPLAAGVVPSTVTERARSTTSTPGPTTTARAAGSAAAGCCSRVGSTAAPYAQGPRSKPLGRPSRFTLGPARIAAVDEVKVVVAHSARATLRVGDVFLKIDADQTRIDVEVEAMALAPIPTPEVLWREPPVLALAAVPGTALGRLGEPSPASPAAWAAAGAAVRRLHDAPLPPWPGRSP